MTEVMTVQLALQNPYAAQAVEAVVDGLEISGPETMEIAIELREGIKDLIAEIDRGYRPHIQRAHQLHVGLCAELRERSSGPVVALDRINTKIAHYELARRQEEERRKRDDEARMLLAARERQAAERAAAQAAGDHETARAIASAPVEQFAPLPAAAPPAAAKPKGVSVAVPYEAELTDLRALVEFAVQNPAMLALIVAPNYDGLNALIKQQGAAFAIPGVRRVPKAPSVRSTGRKR